MGFYIVIMVLGAIVSVLCALVSVIDFKDTKLGAAFLLGAILLGGFANTLDTFRDDYGVMQVQARSYKAKYEAMSQDMTVIKTSNERLSKALRDSEGTVAKAQDSVARAKLAVVEVQKDLAISKSEVVVLKAELEAAKETTQVDRDRMMLLEQENTELRTTLTDIQEAVR